MRVLLDECVPRPLRKELAAHEVRTVVEMGWSGKRNGELLALMPSAGFGALVTVDQGLRFQQNLRGAPIRVIVLMAPSNRLVDLLPLAPALRGALEQAQCGEVLRVGG